MKSTLLSCLLICLLQPFTAWAATPRMPDAVANLLNVTCSHMHEGWNTRCLSGEYRIALYPDGCSVKGTYGNVYTKGHPAVTLLDALPPAAGKTVATLQNKQFVCVTADASKATGEPLWYYVTAIPVQSVKACANKTLCEDPGNLPLTGFKPVTGHPCHLDAGGHYVGDCPAGWVSAEAFGEFSMGL